MAGCLVVGWRLPESVSFNEVKAIEASGASCCEAKNFQVAFGLSFCVAEVAVFCCAELGLGWIGGLLLISLKPRFSFAEIQS